MSVNADVIDVERSRFRDGAHVQSGDRYETLARTMLSIKEGKSPANRRSPQFLARRISRKKQVLNRPTLIRRRESPDTPKDPLAALREDTRGDSEAIGKRRRRGRAPLEIIKDRSTGKSGAVASECTPGAPRAGYVRIIVLDTPSGPLRADGTSRALSVQRQANRFDFILYVHYLLRPFYDYSRYNMIII